MPSTLIRVFATVAILAGGTSRSSADFEPIPQVVRFQPGVVRRGEKTVVFIHGTGLETVKSLDFSHPGFRWNLLPVEEDEKKNNAGGNRPVSSPNRMTAQGAAGVRRVEITAPGNAGGEWCDVRIVTNGGASNPRRLMISNGPAVEETEPNNEPETALDLSPGAVASGYLNGSSDVDYYKFEGRKGEKKLAWLGTTSADSRLPGALEIYDSAGNLMASARDRATEDAWAEVVLPANGTYFLRVFSFGYVQGGPDSFYLLKVGSGPRVESVFPPVASSARRDFIVYGRGLPGGRPVDGGPAGLEASRLRLQPSPEGALPGHPRSALIDFRAVRLPDGTSTVVAVSDTDPIEESADNDTPDKAMPLTLPALVAGRMEKAADKDWYQFEAKKGEAVWLEVLGDRIGTDLDFVLTLRGDQETQGREIDEAAETLHPQWFFNRSEDPGPFKFIPPRDGVYRVMVAARDGELEGGPHLVYALRIDGGKPDFRLITLDGNGQFGAPRIKPGSPATLMVLAARQDGFDGPIDISVDGLPRGVRALPCRIEGGQKGNTLVLESTRGMAEGLGHFSVVGTASVGGDNRLTRREARRAGLIWPGNPGNNNPYPVRIEDSSVVTTSTEGTAVGLTLKGDKREIVVEQGDRLNLAWQLQRSSRVKDVVQVAIGSANQQDLPYRVVNGNNNMLAVSADKSVADFQVEIRANARAGVVIIVPRFQANMTVPPPEGSNSRGQPRTIPVSDQGEQVTLVVLPKRPVQVTVAGPARGVAGETAKLPLRVERQGFYGPLTLASRSEGIRVEVPAGVNEAVVEVPVPANARPGFSKALILLATCEVLPGRKVEQEARLQFNLARP